MAPRQRRQVSLRRPEQRLLPLAPHPLIRKVHGVCSHRLHSRNLVPIDPVIHMAHRVERTLVNRRNAKPYLKSVLADSGKIGRDVIADIPILLIMEDGITLPKGNGIFVFWLRQVEIGTQSLDGQRLPAGTRPGVDVSSNCKPFSLLVRRRKPIVEASERPYNRSVWPGSEMNHLSPLAVLSRSKHVQSRILSIRDFKDRLDGHQPPRIWYNLHLDLNLCQVQPQPWSEIRILGRRIGRRRIRFRKT